MKKVILNKPRNSNVAVISLMNKKQEFIVTSEFSPAVDQSTAVKELSEPILKGNR